MALFNSTSVFTTLFTQTTSTITGSDAVTALLITIIIFVACIGLGIPFDIAMIIVTPMSLVLFMMAGASMGAIVFFTIIYIGYVFMKFMIRIIG